MLHNSDGAVIFTGLGEDEAAGPGYRSISAKPYSRRRKTAFVTALMLSSSLIPAAGATQAVYKNTDGSGAPATVTLCEDPSRPGYTANCTGTVSVSGGTVSLGTGTASIGTVTATPGAVFTVIQSAGSVVTLGGSGGTITVSGGNITNTPTSGVVVAQSTIATTTGSYSSGSVVGGLQTLTGTTGLIMPSAVLDKAKKDCALDLIIFNNNPTSSTITDGSAMTLGGSDGNMIVGYEQATSYSDFSVQSTAMASSASSLPVEIKPSDGSHVYVAPIVRAACTWGVTNGLVLTVNVLED